MTLSDNTEMLVALRASDYGVSVDTLLWAFRRYEAEIGEHVEVGVHKHEGCIVTRTTWGRLQNVMTKIRYEINLDKHRSIP